MLSPRLPAGRPFSNPTRMDDTHPVPTTTVFPTQYHTHDEAVGVAQPVALQQIEAGLEAYRGRSTWKQALFNSTIQGRFADTVRHLLRGGKTYDWDAVLQPLRIPGSAPFVRGNGLRGWSQTAQDEQRSMSEHLGALLCFGRAAVEVLPAEAASPEADKLRAAAFTLLTEADARLSTDISSWGRGRRKSVTKLLKALDNRA